MILSICKLAVVCFVMLSINTKSYASAWTRDKGEALFIFEEVHSSNKFKYILNDTENKENFFIKKERKLYGEYGLLEDLTVGGYFKLYSAKTGGDEGSSERHFSDEFAEVFFTKKLFSDERKRKIFSFKTSYLKPVSFEKFYSEIFNYSETREALDLRLLLGLSNERTITNPFYISNGYFLNIETGVRLLKDSFYNEFIFETTIGFKANQSSMMLLKYELNYDYFQDSFFKKVSRSHSASYGEVIDNFLPEKNYYLSETHHQVKLSSVIYFENDFFLELGLFRSFNERVNTTGFNVSFWFLL